MSLPFVGAARHPIMDSVSFMAPPPSMVRSQRGPIGVVVEIRQARCADVEGPHCSAASLSHQLLATIDSTPFSAP